MIFSFERRANVVLVPGSFSTRPRRIYFVLSSYVIIIVGGVPWIYLGEDVFHDDAEHENSTFFGAYKIT